MTDPTGPYDSDEVSFVLFFLLEHFLFFLWKELHETVTFSCQYWTFRHFTFICGVLLSLIRRFFGQWAGFVGFFTLMLSVVGGLNQTCWDEQFDMKIIPICSADRERCWSNRFRRFYGFDLDFGKGVDFLCFLRVVWGLEGVNFFVDRGDLTCSAFRCFGFVHEIMSLLLILVLDY